jgi:hypothetical protein
VIDGNTERTCSQGYVDSANDLLSKAKKIMSYSDASGTPTVKTQAQLDAFIRDAKAMDQSCDSFVGKYRGVNCVFANKSTNQVGLTDSAKIEENCSKLL